MRCSSCQRSASDSPRSTRSSSACAASSCCCARASSISSAFTASSTRAIARSSSTWKKPGPVANSWISPSPRCTRVEPAFSIATSGACRASTPISPTAPGTISISASPSNAAPSGVTTETEKSGWSAISAPSGGVARRTSPGGAQLRGRRLGLQLLRPLDRLLDQADHVERLLRQVVVLAVEDLGESPDRVLELHVLARRAGELLGDEVWLREVALDLARACDDELV